MFGILSRKKCSKCGEIKPTSQFNKNSMAKDKLFSYCKKCSSEHGQQWSIAHPDKVRENSHRWYVANIDKMNDSHRKRREANIDKVRARDRENSRRYQADNPEKRAANAGNRRARILGNGGTITGAEFEELKARYNYICLACGRREPEVKLTLDHVIPLARGGRNDIKNAQPLCGSCNAKKHAKIIDYR